MEKQTVKVPESIDHLAFRVRFRNVGQGDTIILETTGQGHRYIGVVDCKAVDGKNPVISYLNYLTACKLPFTISFVILTHPHQDHCSGAAELFDYIEGNKIKLLQIGHTFDVHYNYPDNPATAGTLIGKIRESIKNVRNKNKSLFDFTINFSSLVELNNIDIKCLFPVGKAKDIFIDITNRAKRNGKAPSSSFANLLSTALAICYNDKYVLLTSDVNKGFFKRIADALAFKLNHSVLHGAQIPHHGSILNFDRNFWAAIKKNAQAKAVISVGPNDPKHPSKEVWDELLLLDFVPKRTDEKITIQKIDFETMFVEISEPVDPGDEDTFICVTKEGFQT